MIERNIKRLYGRLPERKVNDNNSKESKITMERSKKWSITKIIFSTGSQSFIQILKTEKLQKPDLFFPGCCLHTKICV